MSRKDVITREKYNRGGCQIEVDREVSPGTASDKRQHYHARLQQGGQNVKNMYGPTRHAVLNLASPWFDAVDLRANPSESTYFQGVGGTGPPLFFQGVGGTGPPEFFHGVGGTGPPLFAITTEPSP